MTSLDDKLNQLSPARRAKVEARAKELIKEQKMSKLKNIYLVAKYFAKPKDRRMTSVKGYMADPANVQWDEQVEIIAGNKPNVFATAKIVLNITEQKVERNGFTGSNKSFSELFEYFYTASPKEIGRSLLAYGIRVEKPVEDKKEDLPETTVVEVPPDHVSTAT